MIDLVAVLSSIFLVATGFFFLKRIWELNYGIDIRREVYYLGLLIFCFTGNRVSFLFNFFESGGDVVFDLSEHLGVSQTPIFSRCNTFTSSSVVSKTVELSCSKLKSINWILNVYI